MTRKDYVRIAATLKVARLGNPASKGHQIAVSDCSILLARMLQVDNSRFDRAKFLKACGVES